MTETSTSDNEPVKTVQELLNEPVKTVEELTAEITNLQSRLAWSRERSTYWEGLYGKAREDWNTLNEHIKDYANEANMCAEFERKIDEWNADFKTFTLEGRIKNYDVSVRLTATYYTTVTVEAATPEAAQEQVEEMDSDDIDNKSGLDWKHPDDVEFDVTDVEEA
jgi:hypothetical protein